MTVLPTKLKIKLLREGAQLPTYAKHGDAGADLRFIPEDIHERSIAPGETWLFPTGIALEIPYGYEVQVRPRSGTSLRGLLVHLGTVDSGYRGEVFVCMTNVGDELRSVDYRDRIAQMVLSPCLRAAFEVVDELSESERGTGAFGSSGVR